MTTPEKTPREEGYFFPAEFAPHASTWLSWPHKEESWPGKIQTIYPVYAQFVKLLSEGELVNINVNDEAMKQQASGWLDKAGTDFNKICFHFNPTNDAWCRDHGPAFLINPKAAEKKIIIDWKYNAWGGKYPPYDLDDVIPTRIGKSMNLRVVYPGIVMEGGSVDFNGERTVMTTASCLLNPNRNPHLSKEQIEHYLQDFYGMDQVLWLGDGIEGDDTDGHIDDLTRFVNADTVVTVVEPNPNDRNHQPLQENLKQLKRLRLPNGRALNVVELPMPGRIDYEGMRLPASYGNFYISNKYIVVPVFKDPNDAVALKILESCFPDRQVVGLDSRDIVWGLGAFHCLSQQEPAV